MNRSKNSTEVRETKDGSTTLYSDQFLQHYHNPNGAVAESRHVFFDSLSIPERIQAGESLTVFEMGFGTGLNLLLMRDLIEKSAYRAEVRFFSVEAFPVEPEKIRDFSFGDELDAGNPQLWLGTIFRDLEPGMNRFEVCPGLTLHLYIGPFESMPDPERPVTDHFHDPFSPEVNGELWTPDVFRRLAGFSADDAMLSTYCAATSARAAMSVGGWHPARKRGALGKREMTVAALDPDWLSGLKLLNRERLIQRHEAGDFD